ncbi:MAG: xanthine dehydrogenase, partial [Chloroflexi bacterium]
MRLMSLFDLLKSYIKQDRAVALAVIVRGPQELLGTKAVIPDNDPPAGPLLETPWAGQILSDARDLLRYRTTDSRRYGPAGKYADGIEVFFDVHRPSPRLIIVGGVHIAVDLVHFARPLGFTTYLVDPRTVFASPERFPHVDHIINRWPDEALPEIGLTGDTAVVTVTHDPKIDDPALLVALPSQAFYVGALGSTRTNALRLERLRQAGLTQAQIDRLHAPIGLDIGRRDPTEIALGIIAEIVAVRNGSPLVAEKDG